MRVWTLRDGLQALPRVLPTEAKVALYRRGVRAFQVASFVSPKRLPQMADAEAVWDALILNLRGYERARALGVDRLEMVLSLSAPYERRNAGRGLEDAWGELGEVGLAYARSPRTRSCGLPSGRWGLGWGGWAWPTPWAEPVPRPFIASFSGCGRPFPTFPFAFTFTREAAGWRTPGRPWKPGPPPWTPPWGGAPSPGRRGGNLAWERLAEAGLAPLDRQALEEARAWLERVLEHG
nr:hypothetical protein [Thermus islandicus]